MKHIVFTGPESSGKTTLCRDIAARRSAPFVDEYAREYLLHLPRPYREEDLIAISIGQEQAAFRMQSLYPHKAFLFIDTWFFVLQLWGEERLGMSNLYWEEWKQRWPIDLYILCKPDIPWEPDPMRENPQDRDRLFTRLKQMLIQAKVPYIIAKGSREERRIKVQEELDRL